MIKRYGILARRRKNGADAKDDLESDVAEE
jgi:hypothetical protein